MVALQPSQIKKPTVTESFHEKLDP